MGLWREVRDTSRHMAETVFLVVFQVHDLEVLHPILSSTEKRARPNRRIPLECLPVSQRFLPLRIPFPKIVTLTILQLKSLSVKPMLRNLQDTPHLSYLARPLELLLISGGSNPRRNLVLAPTWTSPSCSGSVYGPFAPSSLEGRGRFVRFTLSYP